VVSRFYLGERAAVLPGEPVAVVEQVDGMPRRVSEPKGESNTTSLSRSDTIRTGEWIQTDARARVALRFASGTSVRLDVGSRARVLSPSVVELSAGAVYVDTESESGRLEVRTALGTARDVGTQFEVRLQDRAIRLRVRTGSVELTDRKRSVAGRAGTEITMSADGAVSRPITAHGLEWDWTASVGPQLEMEGMSLAAFLERIAREHGWTLYYGEPALAREASSIILHGSVPDLSPREMVQVAIESSGLRHRLESGDLFVTRTADTRKAGGVDGR
jgi:ferric-dicitrate binding protein FerR (iron transport regulator)